MDILGEKIIQLFNRKFGLRLQITEDVAEEIGNEVHDIIRDEGYGLCEDCDERRGEPMVNEGHS